MEAKKLTKKDLWKVFRGQLTIRGANNYERQQNAGFTQAMMRISGRLMNGIWNIF